MKKFKLSLKNKALLGIIIVLHPILITLFIVYNQNRTYLKQRILDTLTVIAEAYEGQVYQYLEKAKMRAQDFASDGLAKRKGDWKTLDMYLVNRDKLMITKSTFVKDAVVSYNNYFYIFSKNIF